MAPSFELCFSHFSALLSACLDISVSMWFPFSFVISYRSPATPPLPPVPVRFRSSLGSRPTSGPVLLQLRGLSPLSLDFPPASLSAHFYMSSKKLDRSNVNFPFAPTRFPPALRPPVLPGHLFWFPSLLSTQERDFRNSLLSSRRHPHF